MEATPPKKRGRKPKNKTITNKKADFKVNPKNENLIVTIPCAKPQKEDTTTIDGYDSHDNIYVCETNPSSHCWNCTHEIQRNVSVPLSYKDGVFYLYGSFCCFGCGCRYLFETYRNKDLWEKYALLNLYYNRVSNTRDQRVPIYPSRLRLVKFGGDMTIEDYRQIDNGSFPNDIMLDPIFPVNHSVYDYEAKCKPSENYEYNLHRKTPLKKNKSILGKMNIS